MGEQNWRCIPVVASFAGLRVMPWWVALAYNNAQPLLEVSPDALRFRVLRTRIVPVADVERVDVRTAWRTVNLCFMFRGSVLTFTANVGELAIAAMALRTLAADTPLTERARDLLT